MPAAAAMARRATAVRRNSHGRARVRRATPSYVRVEQGSISIEQESKFPQFHIQSDSKIESNNARDSFCQFVVNFG